MITISCILWHGWRDWSEPERELKEEHGEMEVVYINKQREKARGR